MTHEAPDIPIKRASARNSRRARTMFIAVAVLLLAATAVALWNTGKAGSEQAPSALGSYGLTQVVAGPEAVAQMSRLHGKGVGIVDGYIATYKADQNSLVAYVGQMASPSDAEALNKLMEERIARGNPMFTGLKSLKIEGTRVLSVRSGPEAHYFWAVARNVIWIGLDRDDPAALEGAVRAFR